MTHGAGNGPARLDHLAIRVADRDATAAELVREFDVHVIERTDRFTLVGADFAHGKLTLLDTADGEESWPHRIVSVVLAFNYLGDALRDSFDVKGVV